MEVSGQFHAPTVLPPRGENQVLGQYETKRNNIERKDKSSLK